MVYYYGRYLFNRGIILKSYRLTITNYTFKRNSNLRYKIKHTYKYVCCYLYIKKKKMNKTILENTHGNTH